MNVVSFLTATLVLTVAVSPFGQEAPPSTPTHLSQLLAEAEANNPQISAADHEARAARQMAPQVTTLPDPKVTYQQFSVGSPKPFAGYTNSDFAYIGSGASQELPYPGNRMGLGEAKQRIARNTTASGPCPDDDAHATLSIRMTPANRWQPARDLPSPWTIAPGPVRGDVWCANARKSGGDHR